ncbi:hypothetical protein XBFM1_1410002 [Xenorhabdus bovienii str. feltiae Moldova]|uniref:Uncharacterized protein n=2 Tax=Xenorhabdus bovienii TaxID=40576 RepID=A0A077NNT4_XENBV|nr:hypothetical protein XBFM1_1410002 [Xenorhabdus bovienii str. feltiae Moldova]
MGLNMRRTKFDAALDKKTHVKKCESEGVIADSLEVRMALMSSVKRGEITLEQAQTELKKIQRTAKKNGMKTRSQVWNEG